MTRVDNNKLRKQIHILISTKMMSYLMELMVHQTPQSREAEDHSVLSRAFSSPETMQVPRLSPS